MLRNRGFIDEVVGGVVEEVMSERREEEEEEVMEFSLNEEWNEEIEPITGEEIMEAEILSQNSLMKSTRIHYSSYIRRFIMFKAKKNPCILTRDLRMMMMRRDRKEWSQVIRNYYTRTPIPRTCMIDLRKAGKMFKLWINEMNKTQSMSKSAYSNCRSAVKSLFRMFKVRSGEFDEAASDVLRGVRVRHSEAASIGAEGVKRNAKDSMSFETYCEIASAMLKYEESGGIFAHAVMTTMWNLMSRMENAISICKSHLDHI